MSKRFLKRKPGLQLLSDEPDSLFAEDNNAKRSKHDDTAKKLSRLDEYDKDEGRESSRNFQQWAEIFESNTKGEAIKSKTFMKNFGERVRKQKDRVRSYIQEQEKEFTESKGQVKEVFEKLCSTGVISLGKSSTKKETHILFQEARSAILGGHALLEQFKEADKLIKNHKLDLPTEKWKQDGRDYKELLACGREHGEKLVESKLVPNSYPSPSPDTYKAIEKDSMISELFKDSSKAKGGDNWGTIATDQMEKVSAVAKTIPIKVVEKSKQRNRGGK
ncbi:hypothetical protein F5B19DRAFT_504251 [Rostrohypoxylon terebratum]|nr:hypothetical protein F5B19DRAFT_504251 [Rostrohypoxylon terebratum]